MTGTTGRPQARRLVALLTLAMLLLAGCEGGDVELVRGWIREYMLENPIKVAAAKAGVPVTDPLAVAGVGAYDAIKDIKKGDELVAEGMTNRDPAKIEEAIQLRPKDWSYQLSRANLAAEQGDMVTATRNWTSGEALARAQGDRAVDHFFRQQYLELAFGQSRVQTFTSYTQCTAIYDKLVFLGQGYVSIELTPYGGLAVWNSKRALCERLPH